MRYKLLTDGTMSPVQNTSDIVELTVWFTLITGFALLGLGVHGRQRWLQFWGALTIVCVAVYFMRGVLGLMPV
jgi:hypothetical protein